MTTVFIHGLDSSSKGSKARWFRKNFQEIVLPDFTGTLEDRMDKLRDILVDKNELVLIGSSYGGLMATLYTMENENRVLKLILLAPALNFPDFSRYSTQMVKVPTHLYIGKNDTVCPPDIVIPEAQRIFSELSVHVTDDDHLLRGTFMEIDWASNLQIGN